MTQNITLNTLLNDVKDIWQHSLSQSHGEHLVQHYLSLHPMKHPYSLLAIGKASCAMAQGALLHKTPSRGLVISKHGHIPNDFKALPRNMQVLEAGHPIPDEASLISGAAIQQFCSQATEGEHILCLISGGASSLAELLRPGYTPDDLQRINQQLLKDGKSIKEINRERKKYSAIKGGGLARLLARQQIVALYLSDVEGNDTGIIGSGMLKDPTAPHSQLTETILADNYASCLYAAAAAAAKMYRVRCHDFFLGESVEKSAQRIALNLSAMPGYLHIWGGEPTIKLPLTEGRGGRNQHLALLMAAKLADSKLAVFLSLGTDGTDGNTNYAGAVVTHKTRHKIERLGLNYQQALRNANSAELLEKTHSIIETGPTGTNLMDLMIGYRL